MKLTFSIGLNDKDTKVQQVNTLEAYKLVMNVVGKVFGGGSIFEARGFYTHADKTVVIEPSLMVHTFYDKDDREKKIKRFLKTIKQMLNQESVMIERSDPAIGFE